MAITQTNPINSQTLTRNAASVSVYQMIEDAYKGTGGYLNKNYLVKHKRETDGDFKIRKQVSPYKNYFKTIVDNYVGALYVTQPERSIENPDALSDAFMEDADGKGNRFADVVRWMNADAALYGCVLCVVDNFTEISQSEAVNIEKRLLPYTYWVRPDLISAIYVNEIGALVGVTYAFNAETEGGEYETLYRTWTENQTFVTSDSPEYLGQELETIGEVIDYNLGRLPCFFAYSASQGNDIIIPPRFLSQMEVNDSVFQQTSEVAEYRRKFVFPVLTLQGDIVTDVDADGNKIVKVGADKALQYSTEANKAPEFLTPDYAGLKQMVENLMMDINELETSAGTGNTLSSSASGDTRRVFWQITNVDKADFAQQAERTEQQIIGIFGIWTHNDFGYYDYFVQYSRKFGLDDELYKLEIADARMKLVEEFPKLRAKILAEAMKAILPDVADEELAVWAKMVEDAGIQNANDQGNDPLNNGIT